MKSVGQWQLFGGFDVKITSVFVSISYLVMLLWCFFDLDGTDHTPFIIESHAFLKFFVSFLLLILSFPLFPFRIEFFGSNRCIFDGQHCIRYGEQTGGLLSSFSKWHYRRALACWYYGGIAIGTHLVETLYEGRFLFQQTCVFTTCFFNLHIMLI